MGGVHADVPQVVRNDRQQQRAGARAQPQVQQRGRQHEQDTERQAVQREERAGDREPAVADACAHHLHLGPARRHGAIGHRQQHAAEQRLFDQARQRGLVQPGFQRHARQAERAQAHRCVVDPQRGDDQRNGHRHRPGRLPERDAGIAPVEQATPHQHGGDDQHAGQTEQRAAPVPQVADHALARHQRGQQAKSEEERERGDRGDGPATALRVGAGDQQQQADAGQRHPGRRVEQHAQSRGAEFMRST
jgi:hypothetical protein